MSNKTYCYWSVGNGEFAYLLQTMVDSARQAGLTEDFHVFSDRKINGAITHDLTRKECDLIKRGEQFRFDFKFKYLKQMLACDYDYFVYVDADTLFVRNPGNPLTLLKGDPAHMFFETNLADADGLRSDMGNWWGIPHHVLIQSMHEMGVKSDKIYHVNGGFFIVSRSCVEQFTGLIHDFWQHLYKKGYKLNIDEPLLAYAMHMLCKDPGKHLHVDNLECYGLWYEKSFNPDGKPFLHFFIFSGKEILANPAIVHCIMNKPLLMRLSMNTRERLVYDVKDFARKAVGKPIKIFRNVFNIRSNPGAWALKRVEPS